MPEIAPVSQSVSRGWTALSRGSWKEARAIFEQELEAGESAEALEGLSWAAWWLDDADTVFEARERAYRLYSKGRDPASAARMATWLAADHLDFHGAVAVASGWLRRAGSMLEPLEPLEPGPDHGWLAFHEGHTAGMWSDTVKAGSLALGRPSSGCDSRFTAAGEVGGRDADAGSPCCRCQAIPRGDCLALGLIGATQRGKATGKQLDLPVVHVWDVRDGRIARFRQFADTAKFREVAAEVATTT